MIRAVLDANVIVSAILNPNGTPAAILRAWRDEAFQLLVSDAILVELERVLLYPKLQKLQGLIDELGELAVQIPVQIALDVIEEDPTWSAPSRGGRTFL